MNIPTALSDPPAYLSLPKFNRRLPRCPRTNLPVTYSDIGDENGVPVIYLLPSGCSRWIAAPMDPLLKRYGVRMIVVDRPGCGGTGEVPLIERIERSCEMIVSVLEHLKIRPAHILASSAGIYYTLHLLTRHPSIFLTGLDPPPKVYLLAPWSPLLPVEHPDHWPFKWDWIPTPLIATQHITTPHLIKAATNAQKAYDTSLKAINTGKSIALKWFKAITEEPPSLSSSSSISSSTPPNDSTPSETPEVDGDSIAKSAGELLNNLRGANTKPSIGEGTDIPNLTETQTPTLDENGNGVPSRPSSRMWGECECCVACLTSSYMSAENGQGIGQEHLICLNRGPEETGAKWLEIAVKDLADTIQFAQSDEIGDTPLEDSNIIKEIQSPIEIDVWWGWEDEMVPRKGQLWFNKVLEAFPEFIILNVHDVEDGDHTDL
ncbi:uncharacterized protein IL334_005486 [Kwoniella shivajii]|uniref:AB hydrolase-1 domain-containing protein n=1 Tax=Kwoniella shivajii TaxID=564305 RepID=A0ABZ1D549_9TREE|nr:hypothetical protein IL334_005486 [Kwoniella shivajii]